MSDTNFRRLVRLGVGAVSIFMWAVSVQFSAEGFGLSVPQYKWIGYGLAIGITMFELMLNESINLSWPLVAIGILSYVYGVISNVFGFYLAQGSPDYVAQPGLLVIAVIFSLVIELSPAPAIIWSLGIATRFSSGSQATPKNYRSGNSAQFPQMQVREYTPKQYGGSGTIKTVASRHGHNS